MVGLGADYSWARPGGAALRAAGVEAVGRYLASDPRGITAPEYQDLSAHGIGVWVCREGAATGMLNGFGQGVADAQAAEAQIAAVGLPASIPVHWTADFDIAPGSPEVPVAESYVDGWNTVIPPGRRAGYGGLWFLNYIRSRGKVEYLWECGSTSFRHGLDPSSVGVHLQQTTQNPPVPGTDHNFIYDTTVLTGGGATPLGDEFDMASLEDLAKIIDERVSQAEDRLRRESRPARLYQRVDGTLWIAGPTVVPRQIRPDTPQEHDLAIAKGDAMFLGAGDVQFPQHISDIAWNWLVNEHNAFRASIASSTPDIEALATSIAQKLPQSALTVADITEAIRALAFKAQ